ncbi:MAG: hypothetical protein O3C45_02285 [Bacteroidetes bacterium]|nr:hypothetical protein [Bacteroidota bacterium]MDA0873868.1 hypothetical protein [Bacteroidota bacterium]
MDDRQWMVTCGLAAVFVSAFLYLPVVGHFWTFMVVSVLQGIYLGWQDVPVNQARLGGLVFAAMLALGILFLGFLFHEGGPGNLWGLLALFGAIAGVTAMWIGRGFRHHRNGNAA